MSEDRETREAEKRARLEARLKENLRRRKDQARARREAEPAPAAPRDDAEKTE